MNVKAQGLLNGARWLEETFGRDGLRDVLRACSPAVRDCYTSGIAINWHPVEEFLEFVGVADRVLGKGDGALAEDIGSAGARANLSGALARAAFYLAHRDFLLGRIARLWSQFNDEGEMLLVDLAPGEATIEMKGLAAPNALFCRVLTGWTREVGRALGAIDTNTLHASCIARGDTRCLWRLRWTRAAS